MARPPPSSQGPAGWRWGLPASGGMQTTRALHVSCCPDATLAGRLGLPAPVLASHATAEQTTTAAHQCPLLLAGTVSPLVMRALDFSPALPLLPPQLASPPAVTPRRQQAQRRAHGSMTPPPPRMPGSVRKRQRGENEAPLPGDFGAGRLADDATSQPRTGG